VRINGAGLANLHLISGCRRTFVTEWMVISVRRAADAVYGGVLVCAGGAYTSCRTRSSGVKG
jgi:hypothetical protein